MGSIGFLLAARVNRCALFLWAGDLGWLSALCQFDREIGQVELLTAGNPAANGGLDLLDLVILQGFVRNGTAKATICIQGIQISPLLQIG